MTGAPLTQVPVMHTLEAGTSVLSIWRTMSPLPSQMFVSQSPTVWEAITVPAATNVAPHTPAVQLYVTQPLEVPQSDAVEQVTNDGLWHVPDLQM
jgi:hypothetical protein